MKSALLTLSVLPISPSGLLTASDAAGACGSIFANDTLYKKWGIGLNVYGILVVLLCIAFVVIRARAKRWRNQPPISKGLAAWRIAYGAIPIGLVTVLLILGYTVTPGR